MLTNAHLHSRSFGLGGFEQTKYNRLPSEDARTNYVSALPGKHVEWNTEICVRVQH